jgi:hypothetical protein
MDDNQNIERFFRDKFNQPVKPEKWNIPDNSVWENISTELEKKEPTKKLFVPFILGALILLSGYLAFHSFKQKQEINNLNSALIICNESQEKQIFTSQEVRNNVNTPVSIQKSDQNPTLEKEIINTNKDSGSNSVASENGAIISSNEKIDILKHDIPVAVFPLYKINEGLQPVFPPQPIKYPSVLQLIKNSPAKPFVVFAEKPRLQMDFPPQRIFLGPSLGMMFWMDEKKGNFSNPLSELLINEKTEMSAIFGIKSIVKLSERWSFSGGLEYNRRNQYSQYRVNLPYSVQSEVNAGIDFENHFNHSLPTGLGNVNTNLILSRTIGSQIPENESVLLDFNLSNMSDMVSVPLAVNYYLGKSGNGFYFSGGIRTEIVLKNEITDVNILSHHDIIKNKHFNVEYDALQMNKLNLSVIAGVGYQKSFGKNYILTMEMLYGNALNPVYRTENYQHDINFAGTYLSILKNL